MITKEKEILLGVLTADCIPLGIFDSKNKIVALVHVSRHNIDRIISKTIELISDEFGSQQKGLLIKIGPFIHTCHYELNLEKKAAEALEKNGIRKENIEWNKTCTYNGNSFSHRRSDDKKEPEGRFLTIAGFA